jgi:hypothetical protein
MSELYLRTFADKYLLNCGKLLLGDEILSDGNCFYHSLEYANGDSELEPLYRTIVGARRRICMGIMRQILNGRREYQLSRNEKEQFDVFDEMKDNKEWTLNECEYQAAVDKQKDLCIIQYNVDDPHEVVIRIIRPNGKHDSAFNKDMLFLVHMVTYQQQPNAMGQLHNVVDGKHFITFERLDYMPIEPNQQFINKLNRYSNKREFRDSTINMLETNNVVMCTLQVNLFDPDIKTEVLLLEQPYNNFRNNISSLTNESYQQGFNMGEVDLNEPINWGKSLGFNRQLSASTTNSAKEAIRQVEKAKQKSWSRTPSPTESVKEAIRQVEQVKQAQRTPSPSESVKKAIRQVEESEKAQRRTPSPSESAKQNILLVQEEEKAQKTHTLKKKKPLKRPLSKKLHHGIFEKLGIKI